MMSVTVIGREAEFNLLNDFLETGYAEFLAIYGRRRVGKTFLIRTFFENKNVSFFDVTGEKKAPLKKKNK